MSFHKNLDEWVRVEVSAQPNNEYMWAVWLDDIGDVAGRTCCYRGALTSYPVAMRRLVCDALRLRQPSYVVVHFHPRATGAGDVAIEFTKRSLQRLERWLPIKCVGTIVYDNTVNQ